MPPPGHEPFLRAICENPEDDTVRLVYADWLDENGDPDRAEFIRVQVERARLRASGTDSDALGVRDLGLRLAHGEKWRHELPQLPGVNWQRFWRGFVSGASVTEWRFFSQHADTLFAATPAQFLTISEQFSQHSRQFAASEHLARLEGLTILDGGWGYAATTVCTTLPAGALKRIVIRLPPSGFYDPALARELADAPCLCGTTHLHIRGPVADVAAAVLRDALGTRFSWGRPAAETLTPANTPPPGNSPQ